MRGSLHPRVDSEERNSWGPEKEGGPEGGGEQPGSPAAAISLQLECDSVASNADSGRNRHESEPVCRV